MSEDPKVVATLRPVVNAELVTQLAELLDDARQGKIMNLAFAVARRDHARTVGWTRCRGYGHDLAAAVLELTAGFGQMLLECEKADPL